MFDGLDTYNKEYNDIIIKNITIYKTLYDIKNVIIMNLNTMLGHLNTLYVI